MGLFTRKQLEDLVVIDIETVSGHKDLKTLKKTNARLSELWSKRCEYLRKKHEDNKDLTDDEIYELKAGLQAEFGKIVCITVGYLRYNSDNMPIIKTKSYAGDDETELLSKFFTFMSQLQEQLPDSKITGHSIKRFDIPFICKRGLIHGLTLPNILVVHDKKPWEMSL